MIPRNQELVMVPEQAQVQRASDGNLILGARDLETGLSFLIVLGPQVARQLAVQLMNPPENVTRHERKELAE